MVSELQEEGFLKEGLGKKGQFWREKGPFRRHFSTSKEPDPKLKEEQGSESTHVGVGPGNVKNETRTYLLK